MNEQEFNQASIDDRLSFCEQTAIQFLDECVSTEQHAAIMADDLFTYFESYCSSVDRYFVNRAVDTDWLKKLTKRHIQSRDGNTVDLGWFVYQEFTEEGFHDIILNVKIFQLKGNMRDPNERTFITTDYDPETGLVKIS